MVALFFFLAPLVIGLVVGWHTLRIYLSRSWPTVEAEVTEVEAKSIFERGAGKFELNLDSDHILVYSVGGTEYRHLISDESSLSIFGLKVWRRTPAVGKRKIRYDQYDPNTYVDPQHDKASVYIVRSLFSIGALSIAVWNVI